MDFALVIIAALVASALSLFTGFGLGTLLLPAFALLMPVELAVAATAVVHGANNVLKTVLLGRHADRQLVLRFGIPAIAAAFGGAMLLKTLSGLPQLVSYDLVGHMAIVTPLKLAMGVLMLGFALLELLPAFRTLSFDRRWLPFGGLLSGFFGGLSGHQGALRAAFLTKTGISAQAFVATNAVIGLIVDAVRLAIYGAVLIAVSWPRLSHSRDGALVLAGVLAALAGVILGKRLLKKVTMNGVQRLTGIMLLVIAVLLGMGII